MEPTNHSIDSDTYMSSMKPFVKQVWEKSAFTKPTAIQFQTNTPIIEGKDVIAEAPTGSGKTLAYLLPLLQTMKEEQKQPEVIVLASSRELVSQIHQEVQKWSEGSGFSSTTLIGGANVKRQLEKLKKKPNIIIGTPGRVYELIQQKKLKMHEVKTVVLDEADQLLVPEHFDTIHGIIKSTLRERQLLLFSATLTDEVEQQAKTFMKEPEVIRVDREEKEQPNLEHMFFVSEGRDKIEVLRKIMRSGDVKALAFVNDIGNLSVLAEKLQYKGLNVDVLHGDSTKQDRAKAMKEFRSGKSNLLMATDVAARGLDILDIDYIINVDLPDDVNQYIHRAGRTGRLGSTSGAVLSIVTPQEKKVLKAFSKKIDRPLQEKKIYNGKIQNANS